MTTAALLALAGLASSGHAQDSVASSPGGNDALSAYGNQRAAYAVDLVSFNTSWGRELGIAPILKASADPDPLFRTHLLGSSAISSIFQAGVANAVSFGVWNTAGQGVNPSANSSPASSEQPADFEALFATAHTDLSASATNAVATMVGVDADQPNRLYVERIVAAVSRQGAPAADTSTIAVGGVNSSGNLSLRVDGFNTSDDFSVEGDNMVQISAPLRSSGVNRFVSTTGGTNAPLDVGSTAFLIDGSETPLNVPVTTESLQATVLDFAGEMRRGTFPSTTAHLDGGLAAHRGNLTFSSSPGGLGGSGVLGFLGQSTQGQTDSIGLVGITENPSGAISLGSTDSAVIPSSLQIAGVTIVDGRFNQYLSQEGFRGPTGLVAVGFDPADGGNLIAAAAGTDANDADFIAAAKFQDSGPVWETVAVSLARYLDGPGGAQLGRILNLEPITFSPPAADLQGNLYFVTNVQPFSGDGGTVSALLRANPSASGGYELELILAEGQTFAGANSGTSYTIESITLGDADSVAAGSFHGGQILQPALPGREPDNFGAIVVNAVISYDRNGTSEQYDASLLIAPLGTVVAPDCPGDATGDGSVTLADFSAVLSNFGLSPATREQGDVTGDGSVSLADFSQVLSNFGITCE